MSDELDKARDALATAVEALVSAIVADPLPKDGEAGPRPAIDELERLLNSEDDRPIEILPDGSIREIAPMDGEVEAVGWAILQALHENVPESDRPLSWSDMNEGHEQRIRAAAVAAIECMRTPDARAQWTEKRLREEAKDRGWYVREGTSVPIVHGPEAGGWRHPFHVTVGSRELVELLNGTPVPATTEKTDG